MGRDPGYVAALLDPSRPSRARPTPTDLLALSDVTGIPLVELLESLWAIPAERLAAELESAGISTSAPGVGGLTPEDRDLLAEFAKLLAARRRRSRRQSAASD